MRAKTKTKTKTHTIGSAQIFAHCSKKEKERLEAVSSSVEVQKGFVLTTQGRVGREFGVVIEGRAVISIDGETVGYLQPGDHYGEIALLADIGQDGCYRTATIVADTDMWVSVMTRQEFARVASEFPDAMAEVERQAAARQVANATLD